MNQRPRRRLVPSLAAASLSLALLATSAPAAFAAEATVPAQPAPVVAPGKVLPDKGAPAEGSTVMETKISRDEAVAIATKFFAIPAEMGEPNVNKNASKDFAQWNLNWSTPQNQATQTNINVDIDGVTGAVLSYNKYTYSADPVPALPTYTKEEARKVAEGWLAKIMPNGMTFKLMNASDYYGYYGPKDSGYNFNWVRMEQGYPVRGEAIGINIDARTGELVSLHHYIQGNKSITYTLPSSIIGENQANNIYKSNADMTLCWQYFQEPGSDKGTWKLVYRPGNYLSIGADGAILDGSGQPFDLSKQPKMEPVPAPDKPYVLPAKPLTEAEALAIAKEVSGRKDSPTSTGYNEYGKDQSRTQAWEFNWNTNGPMKEGDINTNVRIDALRGIVLNYGEWGLYQQPKEDEKPKITQAEARAIAKEFIRKVRPDVAGNLMMMPGDPSEADRIMKYGDTNYYIHFTAVKDGILVSDRSGSVNVNARTGQVTNFYMYDNGYGMQQPEIPAKPANVLKPADALNSFLKYQSLELGWNTFYPNAYDMKMSGQVPEPTVKLVWSLSGKMPVNALDAVTGEPLDYSGRNLAELTEMPTDIEGTPAQREIELLWSRRIFDTKDGKFRPNETAKASDLARWLVLAKGFQPYPTYAFSTAFAGKGEAVALMGRNIAATTDAPYFGAALQNGIILPEDFGNTTDPNAPVSKEVFALWVARAMGYGSVVKMPNKIDSALTDKADVGAKYANAVALLNGLGYIKGDSSGRFFPTQSISRGDAAKLIFAVVAEPRR